MGRLSDLKRREREERRRRRRRRPGSEVEVEVVVGLEASSLAQLRSVTDRWCVVVQVSLWLTHNTWLVNFAPVISLVYVLTWLCSPLHCHCITVGTVVNMATHMDHFDIMLAYTISLVVYLWCI